MNKIKDILIKFIKIGIALVLLTPLVLGPFGLNMSEYPKAVFFRCLIEIIFVSYVFLIFLNRAYLPKKSFLLFSVFLFDAILIISSIFGINFYRSFFGEMQRGEGVIMHLHLLVLFIILLGLIRKREDWLRLFKISVIISGLSSVAAIFQQLKVFHFYNVEPVRLSGTLSNPDLFGSYLVLSIFLTIFLLISEKKRNWIILWVSLIILNFYTLILSGTRASWIGLAVGAICIYILNYKNLDYKKRIYSLLVILFIAVSAFLLPMVIEKNHLEGNFLSQRVLGIYNLEISNRVNIWEISIRAFKDRPILGWGFESYSYVSDKYFNKDYGGGIYYDRPHNKVLEILVYAGIVGLLGYILIFCALFYYIFKYAKLWNGYNNKPGILFASIIFAFFVSGFIQNIFSFDNIVTYILFFLVVAFVNNNFSKSTEVDFKKFDTPAYAEKFIFVSTIAILVLCFMYQINIKPTMVAINFNNYFKYENTDAGKALAGYKKGTIGNTPYDMDLMLTLTERSVFLLENGSALNIGNKIIPDLLASKVILYKYIEEKDGGSNRLYEYLIRIDEWAYILSKDAYYLDEMKSDSDLAVKFNKNIPIFYQLIGEMKILQNNYADGESEINIGCKIDFACKDNKAQLYKEIGGAYYKKGDAKMAIKNFQDAINIDYDAKKNGLPSKIENAPAFIDSVAIMYYNYFNDYQSCKKLYEMGIEVYPEYKAIFQQRLDTIAANPR